MKKPSKSITSNLAANQSASPQAGTDRLLADVRVLIEAARQQVAQAVNAGLVTLYWHVGKRIRQEVLGEERAAYGEQIVNALSAQLTAEYGRGFNRPNLFRMIQFAEMFPDEEIVSALRRQLTWTHFRELLVIDDPLKREFYAEMCRAERWSTRTLQDQIKRLVYERTAVSKKPEAVIRVELAALRDEDRVTPDLVFRDPYFLDFLGLPQRYRERDLEDAILQELEAAGIRVAEYLTELPPREMLQRKLHDAILLAREQLARQAELPDASPRPEPPPKAPSKRKKRP